MILVFGGGSDIAKALWKLRKKEVVLVPKSECDITKTSQLSWTLQSAQIHNIKVVVNCAGVCYRKDKSKGPEEMMVNYVGAYSLSLWAASCCPFAKIIHVSSEAGFQAKPDMVGYAASKAAVNSMVKSFAAGGMNIYAVAPTIVDTKMNKGLIYDKKGVLSAKDVALKIIDLIEHKHKPGTILRVHK